MDGICIRIARGSQFEVYDAVALWAETALRTRALVVLTSSNNVAIFCRLHLVFHAYFQLFSFLFFFKCHYDVSHGTIFNRNSRWGGGGGFNSNYHCVRNLNLLQKHIYIVYRCMFKALQFHDCYSQSRKLKERKKRLLNFSHQRTLLLNKKIKKRLHYNIYL